MHTLYYDLMHYFHHLVVHNNNYYYLDCRPPHVCVHVAKVHSPMMAPFSQGYGIMIHLLYLTTLSDRQSFSI